MKNFVWRDLLFALPTAVVTEFLLSRVWRGLPAGDPIGSGAGLAINLFWWLVILLLLLGAGRYCLRQSRRGRLGVPLAFAVAMPIVLAGEGVGQFISRTRDFDFGRRDLEAISLASARIMRASQNHSIIELPNNAEADWLMPMLLLTSQFRILVQENNGHQEYTISQSAQCSPEGRAAVATRFLIRIGLIGRCISVRAAEKPLNAFILHENILIKGAPLKGAYMLRKVSERTANAEREIATVASWQFEGRTQTWPPLGEVRTVVEELLDAVLGTKLAADFEALRRERDRSR